MSLEYGFYEKEVSVLFVKHEKGELSLSELKEKILDVVKEVEGLYESLIEESEGENWSTLAKEQIRWTKKQTLLNAVMPGWWNR